MFCTTTIIATVLHFFKAFYYLPWASNPEELHERNALLGRSQTWSRISICTLTRTARHLQCLQTFQRRWRMGSVKLGKSQLLVPFEWVFKNDVFCRPQLQKLLGWQLSLEHLDKVFQDELTAGLHGWFHARRDFWGPNSRRNGRWCGIQMLNT